MESNTVEFASIRTPSVVESVKDWILEQMIKGNLRPGSKLPTEAELCANLGIGRNSIREAIKQLGAYGVVYIKRAEGTFVSEGFEPKMLSPLLYSIILQYNSWQDFVDLRRAIDIGTLYVLLTKEIDEGELACLEKALEALEETVNSETLDVHAITEADCEFHNCIIALTHNPQLKTLSDYINRITVPSRERTTETVIRNGQVQFYGRLHRELYEIIRDRNKAAIEQTVLNHYIFWKEHNPSEA